MSGEISLEFTEVSYTLQGKQYVLREASGDAGTKFNNAKLKNTQLTDGKVSSVAGMADIEPLLVSLCLFEVGENGQAKRVSIQTVMSWPNRVQKLLFAKAKEISDLDETDEEEEAAKNEPSDTTDGSD